MKCNSVAANGSDFIITGGGVVNNATGLNCSAGFDMDSLMLTVSNPLPPGTYTATIKNGSDGNTLLDNCNAAIVDGDQVLFTIFPSTPTAFDSIAAVGCAPATLDVILNKPVLCSSVAADGSDFVITGTSPVTITSASVSCNNNLTASIKLTLFAPIKTEGNYEVSLKKGNDGNTIINECSLETEADATVAFATRDTVSANFSFNIKYGCKADTVAFSNSGANGINSWNWRFGNNGISTEPNPVYVYPSFGVKEVRLLVTNGTCADSVANSFNLDNELKANFTAPELLCPADLAKFSETSIGKIVSWNWDFGNGSTSVNKTPPAQVYPAATADKVYPARLIVKNDHNCFDTAYAQVKVLYSCYIAVASAFTPNGDGLNEYLYPTNAWKAKNMVFQVYNRFGQLMFETKDFTQKWDGTFKGIKQQTGTYVWTLQYVHTDTGKPYFLKGTTLLIR
jgi:gliding motility-associated-like protein